MEVLRTYFNRLTSSLPLLIVAGLLLISCDNTPSRDQSFSGFDELVEKSMELWDVPGLAIAVVDGDQIVYQRGYGYSDTTRMIPVTSQTLFPICSIAKTFTATAVGMLVDDGVLSWYAPVRSYLPDFELQDSYANERACALDLLSHRTGLGDHYGLELMSGLSNAELVPKIRYLEPANSFRWGFRYSNLMYRVMGEAIRTTSGMELGEFYARRIFMPLGMMNTYASKGELPADAVIAQPHDPRFKDDELLKSIFHPDPPMSEASGDGSIISTVVDMARWIMLQLNAGQVDTLQLVSGNSLAKLHGPVVGLRTPSYMFAWGNDKHEYARSAGWNLGIYRGHEAIRHSGASPGYTTHLVCLPSAGVGVVVMTNHRDGFRVIDIVMNTALDRVLGLHEIDWYQRIVEASGVLEPAAPQSADNELSVSAAAPLPLEAYTGIYEHPAYGRYEIYVSAGELHADFNHIPTGAITHTGANTFTSKLRLMPPMTFIQDAGGNVTSISAGWAAGVKDLVFNRISLD